MDSKDKMLADLRKTVTDLRVIVSKKDQELALVKGALKDAQDASAGINAVRNSLSDERELTKQLSGNIETLKQSLASYKEANDNLRSLNLTLQTENAKLKESPVINPENFKTE